MGAWGPSIRLRFRLRFRLRLRLALLLLLALRPARSPLQRAAAAMHRPKVAEREDPFEEAGTRAVWEFAGTFFVCLAFALSDAASRPLALSCALAALGFAGAHVSGAHHNPAVSIATWLAARQAFSFPMLLLYVLVQILASLAAGGVAQAIAPATGWGGESCTAATPSYADRCVSTTADCTLCNRTLAEADCAAVAGCTFTAGADDKEEALLAEVLGVAMLCLVMLHTTTARASGNNSHFGLAVGSCTFASLSLLGGRSGGAFNPAVAMLDVTYSASDEQAMGHYWAAGVIGAASAALLFRLTAHPREFRRRNTPLTFGLQRRLSSLSSVAGDCIMETLGTAFFSLAVSISRANGSSTADSLALGAAYAAMVCMGAHVSGAHYSPVHSLSLFLRGGARGADICRTISYIVAQYCGAALGAYFAKQLGQAGCLTPPAEGESGAAFVAEALGSGLLALVVLHVATTAATAGNSYFGIAQGLALSLCMMLFSPISGGVFNPAVAVGLSMVVGNSTVDADSPSDPCGEYVRQNHPWVERLPRCHLAAFSTQRAMVVRQCHVHLGAASRGVGRRAPLRPDQRAPGPEHRSAALRRLRPAPPPRPAHWRFHLRA